MSCQKWVALAALVCFVGTLVVEAASVTLAWDASPSTSVVNYRIYYGTNGSGVYTMTHDAGNVLQTTISNIVQERTYWFAATALDSSGLESDFSNEVSYTVPTNAPVCMVGPPGGVWVGQ